MAAEDISV